MIRPQITDLRGTLTRSSANAALWLVRRSLDNITRVYTHYNGPRVTRPDVDQLEAIAQYHIGKDWDTGPGVAYGWCAMYHYAVGQQGDLYQLNDDQDVLWHVRPKNPRSLGVICLIGEGQTPTPQLYLGLTLLMNWLTQGRTDIPVTKGDVYAHRDAVDTQCPGDALARWTQDYRNGGGGWYFPETGYWVADDFYRHWENNGGVPMFGYPIRPEHTRGYPDGSFLRTQYFERARFERQLNGTVTLGLLGAEAAEREGVPR